MTNTIHSNRVVAATGHRPNKLGGYSDKARGKLVRLAMQELNKLRPSTVITGMALGWDTAIAGAAYTLGIPYIAAVPFKGQEKMWHEDSKDLYNFLLRKANKVVYVCDEGYDPWKMQKRNEWMVDNADVILALWDGSKGGTSNCVAYAEGKKPVVNCWSEYESS